MCVRRVVVFNINANTAALSNGRKEKIVIETIGAGYSPRRIKGKLEYWANRENRNVRTVRDSAQYGHCQ